MTTGINPVQAASSKKTNTKRYRHQESAFSQLLQHYLSGDEVAALSPTREDGFERPKTASQPTQKVQGFEVKAMMMQVMKVNTELTNFLLVAQR